MKNNRYPFPVRNRGSVVITAPSFVSALNRVLEKFPDKFVNTKYAKNVEQYLIRLNEKESVKVSRHNGFTSGSLIVDEDRLEDLTPKIKTKLKHKLFMDLLNAKKEAAKKSGANNGKAIYINVDEEGECLLMPTADSTTYAAFRGGHEIAVPVAPTLKTTFKNKLSKQLTNKKMKLPDEELPELDLPQGVELPKENKPKKKVNKPKAKKAAKVVKMTSIESEEEQPMQEQPMQKESAKRPQSKGKAKPLTVKKLAKKAPSTKKVVDEELEQPTKKGKSVRTHPTKEPRKGKSGTIPRQKRKLNREPKNKPSAIDLENARKTLAAWAKERQQEEKERPKRTAKKPAKKIAKKLPPTKKKK